MSIQPQRHNVDAVFGSTQYYIDFYQRDYRWQEEHVDSLLDDIFYKFDTEYDPDVAPTPEAVDEFSWYYLSTYVTNTYGGRTFIVDGQQRFTTLTLILIKLYHLAQRLNLGEERVEWLKGKICGVGPAGRAYWMGYADRVAALDDLFRNGDKTKEPSNDEISALNVYANYRYIDDYLSEKLKDPHRCETFIIYLLTEVLLVEISIDDHRDVSMVFEVINDRGEQLRPHEVFKGALLGQLSKAEVDKCHTVWKSSVDRIEAMSEGETDQFFRRYFQSKYTKTRSEWREFDGEYHRTVFSDKWNEIFNLRRNPKQVRQFVDNEFNYFADLYHRVRKSAMDSADPQAIYFNALNEHDRQFVLIMSAVQREDEQIGEKIRLIPELFDRNFALLQLTGAYDTNRFTESLVSLNAKIRGSTCEQIRQYFDQQLLQDIADARGKAVEDPFQWAFFREASFSTLSYRFIRYFFARVEHLLADEIGADTASYYNLVRNSGKKNGHHVEHILADNEENRDLFDREGEEGEERFYRERNRLGALVLLRGQKNMESNNETYQDKLKTYANGSLWAKTLTQNFYHTNKPFGEFCERNGLAIQPIQRFDQDAVETRQRALFQLARIIWGTKKLV